MKKQRRAPNHPKVRLGVWCCYCDTVMQGYPSNSLRMSIHLRHGKRCPGSGKEGDLHE